MNLQQTIVWHVKNALGALDAVLTSTKNITTSGNLATTGSGTLTAAGASSLTGGIAQATAMHGVSNVQITGATNGTDTAFADNTHFLTSIWLPVNFTCTSIAYLVGSVGGTDKVYGVIYDAGGAVLASSNTTSTGTAVTVGTAAQIQTMNLHNDTSDTPVPLVGPNMIYVGISANGNTAKIRTVPAYLGAEINAGSVSQTHGTIGSVTVPTAFANDKAPYIILR